MTDIIRQIEQAAREAGDIIRSAHGRELHIENKEGHANFVTMYDKKVQDFLTERLGEILPGAKFLGEENGLDVFRPGDEEGWLFVIDPIDGTTNFIHNMHPYVTSIGLMKDGVPYAGVVYAPVTDQMFSAERGMGAYENGHRIHSSKASLEDSVMLSGSAGFSDTAFEIAQKVTADFRGRCQGVRSTGSAEYNLCMTASGRSGGYYEMRLGLWDYAAGGLILEEAGGRITDYYGRPLPWRGPSGILALSEGTARDTNLPDTGSYMDQWDQVI
ncbi:MAG: inositol monophosphatase [Lachnospiraceae bacterium]|nr:inositol monophosphatase [Lachnospiraceae bacterium]